MTQLFQAIWESLKSGDFQAVLALIGGVLTATAPIWISFVRGIYEKVKSKYNGLQLTAKTLIEELNKERENLANVLKQSEELINYITEMQKTNNNVLGTITDRSNLKEDVKQYIKQQLDKATAQVPKVLNFKAVKTEAVAVPEQAEEQEEDKRVIL